jgi:hypothetical protein
MMLVRRFIGRRMAEYYAQPASSVVGSVAGDDEDAADPATPIPFSSLWGEWHWRRVHRRLYERQRRGRWLTPVELFAPHYSAVVANFVVSAAADAAAAVGVDCRSDDGLVVDVVELGGGRGTNAALVLDRLQRSHADLYDRVRYTIVDSSPTLHRLQRERLLLRGGDLDRHGSKIRLERKDLLDVAESRTALLPPSARRKTVVLALELLDNLPHDKVRVRSGLVEQAELQLETDGEDSGDPQASTEEAGETYQEVFRPLSDGLLKSVIRAAPSYRRSAISWIPTVACGVLERLARERPEAALLLADFDWLPPPDRIAEARPRISSWADGEPLVTSMDGADHECYLRAPPLCDILFPTNFRKLAAFVGKTWGHPDRRAVRVQKQADFLQEYGPDEVDATRSWLTGYSPLLHDFGNCSVLTLTHRIDNKQ